jgi:hypothetical protein
MIPILSGLLFPLLALGADVSERDPDPSERKNPDPSKPTHLELDGEYNRIHQVYGRRYMLARILWLGLRMKRWIESSIPSPIQQNLRWRYLCFVARVQTVVTQPRRETHSEKVWRNFLKNAPEWMEYTVRTFGRMVRASNGAEESAITTSETDLEVFIVVYDEAGISLNRHNAYAPIDLYTPGPILLSEAIILKAPGEIVPFIQLPIDVEYKNLVSVSRFSSKQEILASALPNKVLSATVYLETPDRSGCRPVHNSRCWSGLIRTNAFSHSIHTLSYLRESADRDWGVREALSSADPQSKQFLNLDEVLDTAEMVLAGQLYGVLS